MADVRRLVSEARRLSQRLRWLFALCLLLAPLSSGAGPFTLYGPVTFAPGPGLRGALPRVTFQVKNPSAPYTIHVTRVLGAEPFIAINDLPVVGPTDFPEGQNTIQLPVSLQAANSIEVVVVGQAGAQAIVEIIGDDTDLPLIAGTKSPVPNEAGWNNSDVTVSFTCTDATSNIVTCSPPTTVITEGATQVVTGTATDQGGNTASTPVPVSLDKTAPTFTWTSPADGSTVSSPNITATAALADALSGLAAATCNGQAATISAGAISCAVTLNPGSNTIVGTVTDVAGNTTTQNLSVTLATTLTVTDFTPKTGSIGTLVSMSGAGFASTAVVTLNKQGGGTIDTPVSNATTSTANFVVPPGAATGPFTVTVGSDSSTSPVPLTVVASTNFTLSVLPGSVTVLPGQSISVAASLNSANGFVQLADLALSGLPGGLSASFVPPRITAGQTSILTITAPPGQPTGTADLTVSASASVEGLTQTQTAQVQLGVAAATTSFIGRTVVADTEQVPLAGVTVTLLGKNGNGGTTSCTGSTVSDAAGNFAFSGLGSGCVGPQLVGYDGTTATSPTGDYAGVNIVYTLVGGQTTASPVLVHLPRIDNKETFFVQQNAASDQTYSYQSIPGLSVTVYAGTTFRLQDGSTPNPFPLVAVQVPVDRLPDAKPPVPTMVSAFIVAFQPANAVASRPAAVFYPNTLSTAPGVNMTLMTLDPTLGRMVPYGTGTVSSTGTQIVPDLDPTYPGARYGIVNFDWHGPMPGPNPVNPCKDRCDCPVCGDPVDLSSGLMVLRDVDIAFDGNRGGLALERTYRNLWNIANNGIDGAFGYGTSHNYAYRLTTGSPQTANMIGLVTPDGNQLQFAKQADGTFRNATVSSLQGAVMRVVSPGVVDLRWPDGTIYNFGIGGTTLAALEKIIDPSGNITTLVRSGGRLTSVIDPVGRKLQFDYNGFVISQVTDSIGRTVKYSYSSGPAGTQVLRIVEHPDGTTTRYDYAQNGLSGNISLITDRRSISAASNTYDVNGRVIEQVMPDGGRTQFAYKLLNPLVPTSPVNETTVTDALGRQTVYRFNPEGSLVTVTDALGQKRDITRNGAGLITSVRGTAQCSTCPPAQLGDQDFTYDAVGNLTSRTDALANVTTYTYEPSFNRIASVTNALGQTTAFTYDPRGNLQTQTDARGNTTAYSYNSQGLLTETTDALGFKTRFGYDGFANLVSVTDALSNVTRFTYDGISRLIAVQDALGRTTATEYDRLSRVTKQTNALSQSTNFAYDANGNLQSLTDARGKATTFSYNPMNRLGSRTDSLGKSDTRSYDFKGNLVNFVDRRGQTSTYLFDALDRLTEERYADGSVVLRSYDARSRLAQADDSAAGAFTFTRDLAGALVASGGPTGAIQYARDKLARPQQRQVVGQSAVVYTYDPGGNVASAAVPGASVNYTHDALNRPVALNRANGVRTDYAFDPVGRLLSIVHARGGTNLVSLGYSYDAAGMRIGLQSTAAQPLTTQASGPTTYDDANRLVQRGATAYTFDDNGNLTSKSDLSGTTTYIWDARNRLTQVLQPNGQSALLQYDFTGMMMRQADAGPTSNVTRSFTLDALTNVAYQQTSDGDQSLVLAARSIDAHVAAITYNGRTEYSLVDAVNSTVATVDEAGTVQSATSYEPYGQSPGPLGLLFEFGGRIRVAPTLYNFRFRYYDTVAGRFISEDPVLDDFNSFRYARNRPVSITDPFGLWPFPDLNRFVDPNHREVPERYIPAGDKKQAIVDLRHYVASRDVSLMLGGPLNPVAVLYTNFLGAAVELRQLTREPESALNVSDLFSNVLGSLLPMPVPDSGGYAFCRIPGRRR